MSLALGDERRIPIGRSIVAGLRAPWVHAGGLLKCSALWLVTEFLYQLEASRHSAWRETAEGEAVWEYKSTDYGDVIFVVRLFALAGFFLSWSRGLYFQGADKEFRLWRFERRLWWLFRDSCKLLIALTVMGFVFALAFGVVGAIIRGESMFATLLGSVLAIGLMVVIVGITCRLATFFTAIAVDEEPAPVVDAAEPTKGFGFRIFLVLTPLLVGWSAVDAICFGDGSIFNFRVPGAPFWPLVQPEHVPPMWTIGLAAIVDGIFLASLFATLVELYRYITPPTRDDEAVRLF